MTTAAASAAAPIFDFELGASRVDWPAPVGIRFEFDRLHADRRSGEVRGEVRVLSTLNGAAGVLHHSGANLLSTRSHSELAKHLATKMPGASLDWSTMVETACERTLVAYRAGEPAVLLRDVAAPVDAGLVLPPLLLGRQPVIVYGDGGSTKSLFGLAAGTDLHTGSSGLLGLPVTARRRTGLLDYEFDSWEHRERLRRYVGEPMPDLVYVRCQEPLSQDVERIAAIIRAEALEYLILDSVGYACDGPPEEAASALAFFQALRRLQRGALCIAHVNRTGDVERPFGSAFWHNSARATWYAKKDQEVGEDDVTVALVQKKANTARLHPPLGFRFTFAEDRTRISRVDLRESPTLAGSVPLKSRIAHALAAGPLKYHELATNLGADVDSVIKAVQRDKGRLFTVLTATPDNVHRVALLARQEVLS